ncbi:hypothetical protein RKD37_001082 [Streptomyces ambofaciens]
MRGAAHGDDLVDGEVEVGRRVLDHRRHGTGQLPHRQRPGVASVDEDLAGVGAQDAVDGAQEACLPLPLGPTRPMVSPGRAVRETSRTRWRAPAVVRSW